MKRETFNGADAWEKLTPEQQHKIGALALELGIAFAGSERYNLGGACDDNELRAIRPFDAAEDAAKEALSCVVAATLPEVITVDIMPVPSIVGPVCRECGCSHNDSCDPPCSWVERDLCSNCQSWQVALGLDGKSVISTEDIEEAYTAKVATLRASPTIRAGDIATLQWARQEGRKACTKSGG